MRGTSDYLKIRDRASYEFALVSVAAALEWMPANSQCRALPWAEWRTSRGAPKPRNAILPGRT